MSDLMCSAICSALSYVKVNPSACQSTCQQVTGGAQAEGAVACGEEKTSSEKIPTWTIPDGGKDSGAACIPDRELCNGTDDDCDGETDEDLYFTCGQGPCLRDFYFCENGVIQYCNPYEGATAEICDGIDNNCNGSIDENGVCETRDAGSPPVYDAGTPSPDAGVLVPDAGNLFPDASYPIPDAGIDAGPLCTPQEDICDNLDNDCDGQIDGNLARNELCGLNNRGIQNQECREGAWINAGECNDPDTCRLGDRIIYPYPWRPETENVGICHARIDNCRDVNGLAQYVITPEVLPSYYEACNGLDDDCDGETDEPSAVCLCDPDRDGYITNRFVDPAFLEAIRQVLFLNLDEDVPVEVVGNPGITTIRINNHPDINDISGIECFAYLREFGISPSQISSLEPLAGSINLSVVILDGQFSDLTPLSGLTNLHWAMFVSSQITDITALINNPGLGDGDSVWFYENPQIPEAQIETLRAKGVTVYFY